MPFKSEAQRRFFYAAEKQGRFPKGTAARWQRHTPSGKLPEKVASSRIFHDELAKIGAPRAGAALRWASKEILYPALPTAVLAVLANEAVKGADSLRARFAARTEPIVEKRKKKRRRRRS